MVTVPAPCWNSVWAKNDIVRAVPVVAVKACAIRPVPSMYSELGPETL